MDTERFVTLIKEAKGDRALLAHAQIEFLCAESTEAERSALHAALDAAAIPHWFDEEIIRVTLDKPLQPLAGELAQRLRTLPFTEPFPARGADAANVHEATRHALRGRLYAENPERLRELARRVQAVLPAISDATAAPHLRIEALYQRFISDPARVADKCGAIFREWKAAGQPVPLIALRTMLEELINHEGWVLSTGLVCGAALYYLVRIRNGYPRLNDEGQETEELARKAIGEFESAGVWGRALRARVLLGDVLASIAPSDEALRRAIIEYEAAIAFARSDKFEPSDEVEQRLVSEIYKELERVHRRRGDLKQAQFAAMKSAEMRSALPPLSVASTPGNVAGAFEFAAVEFEKKGRLADALNALRNAVSFRESQLAEQPAQAEHRGNLAMARKAIGDLLCKQGNLRAAIGAFREGMALFELLAQRDPLNAKWQKDLADVYAQTGKALIQLSEANLPEARRLIEWGASIMQTLAQGRTLTLLEQPVFDDLQQLATQADAAPIGGGESWAPKMT